MNMYVCICVKCVQVSEGATGNKRPSDRYPRTRVTGGCGPPSMVLRTLGCSERTV